MIRSVMSFQRAIASLLSVSLVASLGAPAAAQSADGWFDDGSATAPSPAPAPSVAPAPARADSPPPPLAQSPLLEEDADTNAEDQDPRALTVWNSYVDPYGTWVEDSRYGRVWMPSQNVVGSDFAPYSTAGHWALDENEDWVWVSDYPFGWVTFHYGRWVWIGGRGWAWVPGLRYAPAWVAWRVPVGSYAYVGWAPLPPSYIWFGGGAILYAYDPLYPWVFCPSEYVFAVHVHHHLLHDHYAVGYAARYTRPYYPAQPRSGGYHVAAPRSPTTQSAHVPVQSVPSQRVSSRAIAARAPVTRALQGSTERRQLGTLRSDRGVTPVDRGFGPERAERAPRDDARPTERPRLTPAPRPRAEQGPRPDGAWDIPRDRPRAEPKPRPAPRPDLRPDRPRDFEPRPDKPHRDAPLRDSFRPERPRRDAGPRLDGGSRREPGRLSPPGGHSGGGAHPRVRH